jgi:hypothetical protein
MDNGFSSNYEYSELPGLTGDGPAPMQFSRPGVSTFREGVVVRVEHKNGAWIGNFQRGDVGVSAVVPTPDPDCLAVCARGVCYIVPVSNPETFRIVPMYPVYSLYAAPEVGILLFVNTTQVLCIDKQGVRWKSRSVSWHGVDITSVSEDEVTGTGHYTPDETEIAFYIDIRTGKVRGGPPPAE